MIFAILQTLSFILNIVWWVFLIMIIMSWLISFNVINTRNQFVASVWRVLNQITEPILKPIRRIVPPDGRARPVAADRLRHHLLPAEPHQFLRRASRSRRPLSWGAGRSPRSALVKRPRASYITVSIKLRAG